MGGEEINGERKRMRGRERGGGGEGGEREVDRRERVERKGKRGIEGDLERGI